MLVPGSCAALELRGVLPDSQAQDKTPLHRPASVAFPPVADRTVPDRLELADMDRFALRVLAAAALVPVPFLAAGQGGCDDVHRDVEAPTVRLCSMTVPAPSVRVQSEARLA